MLPKAGCGTSTNVSIQLVIDSIMVLEASCMTYIILYLMSTVNWTYKNQEVTELPDDCVGFVYEITNTTNNMKYIG